MTERLNWTELKSYLTWAEPALESTGSIVGGNFQEDLTKGHLPGLLLPVPLSLKWVTANPCRHRRPSNTSSQNPRIHWNLFSIELCCYSVAQSCPTLCDPIDCSTPGFPVLPYLSRSLLKLISIKSVMPSNYLVLCHPLLPSIFPSTRDFFNESALQLAKYWRFSFSISPSNEYSGLISLRIDWFDLLSVQGTLKSLL